MSVAPSVIVVNSLVARGSVGGRASVFVLERLGIPVIFAPTVLLPWHPGHGPGTRVTVDPGLLDDLAGVPAEAVAGCLTGYFGDGVQVASVLRIVARLREANGRALVMCDPVVGDSGRFYVGESIRDGVRALARQADIVAPNRFELAFLAGLDFAALADTAALVAAARSLGRPEVVVTSAFAAEGEVANLLVSPRSAELVSHRAEPRAPHGTGDLLAALYFGHRLGGADPRDALARAASATLRLVELAAGGPELPLTTGQDAFFMAPEGMRVEAVEG
jgi:pyridoxine kinase